MMLRRPVLGTAILALGLLLAIPASAQQSRSFGTASASTTAQEYSYARVVRLSYVEGDVQVLRPEAESWEEGLMNLPIRQGYTISTGQGRAEIEFESGATARLAERTTLQFIELALADGARITRLSLQQGTATFYSNLSGNDVFLVATPDLEATVPDNSRFRMDVLTSGTTLTVLRGDLDVNADSRSYHLSKGETLIFQQAATDQVQITRNREMDEWDRWVADRDDAINTARNNTQQYVRAPFRYGLSDLSNYGSWYQDSSYGYVWQPYGVGSGWSPYWQGRWVYIHRVGWTWVSSEPWGWLPYHYGRWLLTYRGWVWIPGGFNYWSPGLVYWFHVDNGIGWCPLGPRDHFGRHPRHPQGGVIITNTPRGVIGGSGNHVANANTRPRFVAEAPLPRNFVDDSRFEMNPHIRPRGGEPAEATGGAAPAQFGGQGTPRRPAGENPGIVYDPDEHRFVNNPRAPQRPADEDRQPPRSGAGMGGTPAPVAPNAGAVTPRETPADRPARPGWGSTENPRTPPRNDGSATMGRPSPPPRTETPRPTPPPRTETPRPVPPPRAETPRPTPPPRTETPRPTPPPRTESPRPSPPPSGGASMGTPRNERPSPPPRSESPRPKPRN